jgi:hypothetical protein
LMARHRSSVTTGKGLLGEQPEGFTVVCFL